jgi:HAE1 family hydrophobic/amphiphilic exporter-1
MFDIFITKKRFTWFTLVFLILAGMYVLFNIPKESFPEIKIPIVGVTTAFPGASSSDVEQLVTDPIEKQLLRGLSDVKEISSTSREGVSSITIEFEDSIDLEAALSNVQDEIAKVENELPSNALDPFAQEFSFDDQPIYIVSLSSTEAYSQLSASAKEVEDKFLDINGVSRVEVSGIPEKQITIIVNKSTLSTYNLNMGSVSQAINQSDISFPVGSIVQEGVEYNVSLDNTIKSIEDIENIIIGSQSGGSAIYLKDIARIEDGLAPYDSLSRLSTGGSLPQQAITFSIFKQVGFDVTAVTADANNAVSQLRTDFEDMSFVVLIDSGDIVSSDIASLTQSALLTILLVVIVLSLGLGFRESIIAGIAVPLSFLLSFIGLYLTGNTINFISLFALILAIGLLVDASVVIIEGITLAREKGLDANTAIRSTLKEFAAPVIAGTMTTLVVFLPLITLSGTTGQFIKPIPITIAFVLIGSLIVGLIYVPIMSTLNIPLTKDTKLTGLFKKIEIKRAQVITDINNWYKKKLNRLLESKRGGKQLIITLSIMFVVSIGLVITGQIKSEFFPPDNFDQITIAADLPQGSLLDDMSNSMKFLESYLQESIYVESFVTQIQPNSASITVILDSKDNGDIALKEIRDFLKTNNTIATFQATPPSGGPSAGAPFSVTLKGNDYDELIVVATEITKLVEGIDGTVDIESSVSDIGVSFALTIDPKKVKDVGLDMTSIAAIIRSSVFGSEVATISRDGDDIDVILIAALNENYTQAATTNYISVDELRSLSIQTPSGEIPLGALTTESIKGSNPSILHIDGDRVITVSSYLEEGVILSDITNAFNEQMRSVNNIENIEWSLGGEARQSAESGAELGIALLIGIALMIGVLIFQFDSIRNTFFIISVVPLGLIGVILGLFFFNQTLSFTAMLGFVALTGIVVNNSIILIDVITSLQKEKNLSHRDIVIKGSVSRIRPILLTTITTVTGMAPLLFTSPVWRPLALAIITGLLFAVVLTLFLIPFLFYQWGRK